MGVLDLDKTVMRDWLQRFYYGDESAPIRSYARDRIVWDGARVYSYGRHFPLWEYARPSRFHPAGVFILNGDRWRAGGWSSRTNDHQSIARELVSLCCSAASVILPFSTLDGAGIDVQSIRVHATRPDANWTERHYAPADLTLDELETASRWFEKDERRETDYRGNPCAPHGVWFREYLWRASDGHTYGRRHYRQAHTYDGGTGAWRSSDDWNAPVSAHWFRRDGGFSLLLDDSDGTRRFYWETHHHRLGDSLISAVRPIEEPERPARPFESNRDNARERVTLRVAGDDRHGRYAYCESAEGREHEAGPSGACIHCGGELLAAVTWRRRARYLSSFDHNENPPLYFLAEVPRNAPNDVAGAIDALAPRAVHAALARGRRVERQGDVFFIETDLTRDELTARGAVFCRLTRWTRWAKPRKGEPGYQEPQTELERRREHRYARRRFRHRMRAALDRAYSEGTVFPSSSGSRRRYARALEEWRQDVQRARDELRRATFRETRAYHSYNDSLESKRARRVAGIARARGALETLLAEGPRYLRTRDRDRYRARYGQNAVAAWQGALHEARERFRPFESESPELRETVRRHCAIYGTAHSATETATVAGAVYVTGIVRHVPGLESGRAGGRDHRNLRLGDKWFLAVRNTVPRQALRRRNRRRSSAGIAG